MFLTGVVHIKLNEDSKPPSAPLSPAGPGGPGRPACPGRPSAPETEQIIHYQKFFRQSF